MKMLLDRTVLLAVCVLGVNMALGDGMAAESREAQWKGVREAVEQGLPKSAIEKLRQIADAARSEKAFAEAIRATGWSMTLEAQIEGFEPVEVIRRLQKEIPAWPAEARPLLEVLLARWYWNFFQEHRWQFAERTQTDQGAGDDPATWDLARILAEIDVHYTAALGAGDRLRAVPVREWDGLLEPGTQPDEYRPTLYDFVAAQALEFYQAGEQAGNRSEGAFELEADSPVFGTRNEFLAWELPEPALAHPLGKALRIYQELLRFHEASGAVRAVMEADLGRLRLGRNQAAGEVRDERYRQALARFVEENGNDEISARARALWAGQLREEEAQAEAHAVALAGSQAFPGTVGGHQCHNLIQEIEEPGLSLMIERVWNQPGPEVRVSYRNLTGVHFRIVKYDFERLKRVGGWGLEELDQEEVRKLAGGKPLRQWSRTLPATVDFAWRTERVEAPGDLAPGLYVLLASQQADFRQKEGNQVSQSLFWVSDLALVLRTEYGRGEVSGFILRAGTGEPVAGARVEGLAMRQVRGKPLWESFGDVKSDEQGWFALRVHGRGQVWLLASQGGQQLASMQAVGDEERTYETGPELRTLFFTDRSIYRPGQTIRYKGLSVRLNRQAGLYETRAGEDFEVVFSDVNGQEIGRQRQRSNDFGSFAGSFQAPRDRLLGRMSLRVDGEGEAAVQVEEYKRPKFQVELRAPGGAVRLGGEIEVTGKAEGYTGAPVDGAAVSYRVVRETRYPVWWRWWEPVGGDAQEIAHGRTRTGMDGSFALRFVARPDRSAAEKDDPKFRFTVFADVTDAAGETRSGERTVNLGYTALEATLEAEEWQEAGKPVEVRLSTRSLDGEGRAARGKVRIHRLMEPERVNRAPLQRTTPWGAPAAAADGVESWDLGEVVSELEFATGQDGRGAARAELPAGLYRWVLETGDGLGKTVGARLTVQVLDPAARKLGSKLPFVVAAPKWRLEPGESFQALWGTGYEHGRAFVEVVHRGKHLVRSWTEADRTQQVVQQAVNEGMRGGFHLLVTMVRENRAYTVQRKIEVPWSNKQLAVKWESHRSKLEPGAKEKWTAVVTGPDAERVVAEVVAGLYDASLDAFLPHAWEREIGGFYQDSYDVAQSFQNRENALQLVWGFWKSDRKPVEWRERSFPTELVQFELRRHLRAKGMFAAAEGAAMPAPMVAPAPMAESAPGQNVDAFASTAPEKTQAAPLAVPASDAAPVRRNLEETAFFYPQLISGGDGVIRLEFTMPEALTAWKFQAFAHDRKLRAGFLEDQVVTAKDLMVQPNPPRFLREGDELEFTVKVLNRGTAPRSGTVKLNLQDARTLDAMDGAMGNTEMERQVSIPAGESRTVSWRLQVPDSAGVLIYRAVAAAGDLSDGEEGYVPVLPRRILVTESLTLPVRGPVEKPFRMAKLADSGASDTLRHESLTLQMVSNPNWYAIMALPYLMEFPHECSEQVFSRYYANTLGQHVVESDPKVRRVFELWKGTEALDSPLEKNEEIKSLLLEETPWVRQAKGESESRRNVAVLFDANRLHQEREQAWRKLSEQQREDGAWPWFAGGPASEYITLHVVTGFGRLRHLGVADVDTALAQKALGWLDASMSERHRRILESKKEEENHLSPLVALYLYGRSFFLADQPVAEEHRGAVEYFLGQAQRFWNSLDSRMAKGQLALALQRFQVHPGAAAGILASLKEYSVQSEELGMYWKDGGPSYWWQHAPIESQALLIEAFDEVAHDAAAVEDLKVWLLKQKQTQSWKSTKATADAVYALLRRGADALASGALVEVSLGGQAVTSEAVEAGTGYFEKRFPGSEVRPALGDVSVRKRDAGVAWGSLHWQYLETMEKISPQTGNPLKLTKSLFRKENTAAGPVLRPLGPEDALSVGDLLVTRVEVRSDRAMEFLHLKDQRGSGLEPVEVLSGYRHQDGLGYYQTTRDTATHFFFDQLPAGAWVLETEQRVVHRGAYQSGTAEIQCMYAPEFSSHSQSFALQVR